ncbi:MAG: hypothetical protein ACRDJM_01230 [Actinomycetota bacterium]
MAGQMKVGPRERALLIILAAIVLLAAVYLLFLKPGDEPGQGVTRPTFRPSPTSTLPRPTGTPETVEVFEGRDPFEPRIRPTGAPGGPTPTPGQTGGTRTGTRVVLLDIFTRDGVRYASVEVGGQVHNVKEGDVFGGNYRVVSITEDCATFVLGDERFTLCIGQEVFK